MAKVDRERLRALVAESGKSARAHSLEAGLGATAIKDILSGKSMRPESDTLVAIANQLGVPLDQLLMESDAGEPGAGAATRSPRDVQIAPRFLAVRYKVAAGVWFENEFEEPAARVSHPVVPDPRYSNWPQWLELVEGDSADKKIPGGQYAHVVDAIEMGYAPQHKDWVIVERRRNQGQLRERTIKQIEIREGVVYACPRSTNPKWSTPVELHPGVPHAGIAPPPGEEVEVEIVGLVIGAYNPDF